MSGITLIALIVTIIVLLILTGIAISTLVGENGLIRRAADIKIKNERARIIELTKLAYNSVGIDNLGKYSESTIANLTVSQLKKDGIEVRDIPLSSQEISNMRFEPLQLTINMGESENTILQYTNSENIQYRYFVNIFDNFYELKIELGKVTLGEEVIDIDNIGTTSTGNIDVYSEDNNIATIIRTGNVISVTSVGVGNTKIIATYGNLQEECSITVIQPTLQGIKMDIDSNIVYMADIDVFDINVSTYPDGITGEYNWTIENEEYATIFDKQDSKVSLRGKKAGTTRLYATDNNGTRLNLKDKNNNVLDNGVEVTIYKLTAEPKIEVAEFPTTKMDFESSDPVLANLYTGLAFENENGTRILTNSIIEPIAQRVVNNLKYEFKTSSNISGEGTLFYADRPGYGSIYTEVYHKRTGEYLGQSEEKTVRAGKLFQRADAIACNQFGTPIQKIYKGDEVYFAMYFIPIDNVNGYSTIPVELFNKLRIVLEPSDGIEIIEEPQYVYEEGSHSYSDDRWSGYRGKIRISENIDTQQSTGISVKIYRNDYDIGVLDEFIFSLSIEEKPSYLQVDKVEISYNGSTDENIEIYDGGMSTIPIDIKYFKEITNGEYEEIEDDGTIIERLSCDTPGVYINPDDPSMPISVDTQSCLNTPIVIKFRVNDQEEIYSNSITFTMQQNG